MRKKVALNDGRRAESNLTMKYLVLALVGALVLGSRPAPAQTQSWTSIFTNAAKEQRPVRRASFIYIACHGLGWGDLSCYGQTNFQTPNIDRLAAEGTRFTGFRVTSEDPAQAQAALMTGNTAPLAAGSLTLGRRLQQTGYFTGLFGEWLLGPQPWQQGFDDFGGFLNEGDARNYYSDFFERHAPRAIYDQTNRVIHDFEGREEIYENTGHRQGKYMPDFFLGAAGNFARTHKPDTANHFRPFFLLVDLPAPQSATPGRDDYPVPTDAPYGGENWPQAAKNRAALMTRLDNGVGHLLEGLTKWGLTNDVVIFFTAAMAPPDFASTNLSFLKVKGEVRGGNSVERLRVPMIVRWPGHVPAGRVSDLRWDETDVAPTLLQIGYGKPSPTFTGVSIWSTLLGKTNLPPAALQP